MLVLRCTARLLRDVRRHVPAEARHASSTTRLGDWFANRVNIAQRRYVIAVSATTLLPVLVPARDPAGLPARITDAVARLLELLAVDETVVAAELREMRVAQVAGTNDRSVVAAMNETARHAYEELYDLPHRPGRTLDHINLLLADLPRAVLDYRTPSELTRARLS